MPFSDGVLERLREQKTRLRVSQRAISEMLGWSQSKVAQKMSGRTRISVDELDALCGALEIRPENVLDDPMKSTAIDVSIAPPLITNAARFDLRSWRLQWGWSRRRHSLIRLHWKNKTKDRLVVEMRPEGLVPKDQPKKKVAYILWWEYSTELDELPELQRILSVKKPVTFELDFRG
jgi:transcriptional regulator with XRE-family HTH domain